MQSRLQELGPLKTPPPTVCAALVLGSCNSLMQVYHLESKFLVVYTFTRCPDNGKFGQRRFCSRNPVFLSSETKCLPSTGVCMSGHLWRLRLRVCTCFAGMPRREVGFGIFLKIFPSWRGLVRARSAVAVALGCQAFGPKPIALRVHVPK